MKKFIRKWLIKLLEGNDEMELDNATGGTPRLYLNGSGASTSPLWAHTMSSWSSSPSEDTNSIKELEDNIKSYRDQIKEDEDFIEDIKKLQATDNILLNDELSEDHSLMQEWAYDNGILTRVDHKSSSEDNNTVYYYKFNSKADAIAFKLKWGGK